MSTGTRARQVLPGLIAGLVVAGCSPDPGNTIEQEAVPEQLPEMTMPQAETPRDLGDLIELASEDLRERLESGDAEIAVERAEQVTWRSGALGCPDPEMMYTQALVPGYRIVLVAAKQRYHYHGAEGQAPFLCPHERAESPLEQDQSEL